MKRGFKSWANKKSLEIRKRIGLRSNDPLDCELLSEELGIPIFTLFDLNKLGLIPAGILRNGALRQTKSILNNLKIFSKPVPNSE